jgi:hypothetical protein
LEEAKARILRASDEQGLLRREYDQLIYKHQNELMVGLYLSTISMEEVFVYHLWTHSKMQRFSTLQVRQLLEKSMTASEDKSEETLRAWTEGEMAHELFLKEYKMHRKSYHANASRLERLNAPLEDETHEYDDAWTQPRH